MKKKINAAVKLFQDFTGHDPAYVDTVNYPVHPVLTVIGYCDGVMYDTMRDGRKEKYVHRFKKGCRPVLAVSFDGKQLYMIAGSYQFTDRGIVDNP